MLTPQFSSSTNTQPKQRKPFDIFGFISRFLVPACLIGSILFLSLSPLLLTMKRHQFQAEALLKIDPVVPSLITKSEDPSIINYFHDFARTQVKRLSEFGVLADAIDSMPDQEKAALFGEIEDQDTRVTMVRRQLSVRHLSRTHLLEVGVRGPDPRVPAVLVNSIMDAFIAKSKQELIDKHTNRLDYLQQKRTNLLGVIQSTENALKVKAGDIHTATFTEDFNLNHHRAQWIQKAYVQGLNDRISAENRLSERINLNSGIENLELEPMVSELVMNDQSIDFTSSWTYQQLQKMRASIDGISPQNPDRQNVERRMDAMREYERQLKDETYAEARGILSGKRQYDLAVEELTRKADYQAALVTEKRLSEYLDQAKKASAEYSKGLIDATALKTQLTYHRDLLFRIDTRIHELKAEAKAPLRVSIESRARAPRNPIPGNHKKMLIFLIAFSFGSVFGVCFILDFLDDRIKSAKDVQHALGVLPNWPITRAANNFSNILTAAPTSSSAKAVRSLAGRLYKECEEGKASVFLFTGSGTRVGTSAIALNCAEALTQFNQRTLVIAFSDPSTPEEGPSLQRYFLERCSLQDCIQRDERQGVDVIKTGDLLSISRVWQMFDSLLEQLKADYGLICLDTPPILHSDQTEWLASAAQVCVLIANGAQTRFTDLKMATRVLTGLQIPAIAPVLNWGAPRKATLLDKALGLFPRWMTQLPLPVPGYTRS